MRAGHGADKEIALPARESVTCVHYHSRRANRWNPIHQRLFHSWTRSFVRYLAPVIVNAVGDDGPTIIFAASEEVDFVATARSMFGFEQRPRLRVDGKTLWIAVTIGEDFTSSIRAAGKGIVGWNRAVVPQAENLSGISCQILR